MGTAITWVLVFVGLMGALVWVRIRESRYLKKRTRDAIRPELRKEFESEVEDAVRRKAAFQDALQKFVPKD
ncbi:MAG: hypothetical protein K8R69_10070 [Deltaproteobacteria bacterium]|nr:hypothetical protein [Deltaproteobacteria bacterium]